jgi:hypothetical protein
VRDERDLSRRSRPAQVCLLLALAFAAPARAEEPSVPCRVLGLRLEAPASGATIGGHPLFLMTVRVEGVCDDIAPVIQASHSDWRTIERSWSYKDSPRGWRQEPGDSEIAIAFRPPEALEEETWQWRARVFAEGVPTESGRSSPFKVDVTPPAEIEGLHLQRRSDGAVLLRWDAVIQDIEGRPESVDHYVIYRYDRRGTFPQGPLVKVGESHTTAYVDRRGSAADKNRADIPPLLERDGPPPASSKAGKARAGDALSGTIYYKIVAVDVAGNELGVREGGGTSGAAETQEGSPTRARPGGGKDGGSPRS